MRIFEGAKTTTTATTTANPTRIDTPTQDTRQECYPLVAREDSCSQKMSQNLPYGRTLSNSSTKSREPSGPQDELLEIINDFKNNVFTISEVERLVENWQKRNDVQQSFKDKQRQLTAMREEYDRIQKKLKEEMRTPTPLDKIRKFFSKGKKGECDQPRDCATSFRSSIVSQLIRSFFLRFIIYGIMNLCLLFVSHSQI